MRPRGVSDHSSDSYGLLCGGGTQKHIPIRILSVHF